MTAPPPTASEGPAQEYRLRLQARRVAAERWRRLELTISLLRLVVVVVGLVAAWLSIQSRWFSPAWLVLPVLALIVLVAIHERVLRRRDRLLRSQELYRRGLGRLRFAAGELDLVALSREASMLESGVAYAEVESLFAQDLDLFGRASLFELLCAARTGGGRDTLAGWLLEPASIEVVGARQAAVSELRERVDLREELYVLGGEVESELEPRRLLEWARGAPALRSRALHVLLLLLAVANLTAAAGWPLFGWGYRPLLVLLVLESVLYLYLRPRLREAVRGVERASRDLEVISGLLVLLEQQAFESPLLVRLVGELRSHSRSPGREIRRLQRLVELLESRRNPLFAPLGVLLLWSPQLAFGLERWRLEHGDQVARWLEILGEVEALASFARHAYENPGDPFPRLMPRGDAGLPLLRGEGLGHPLLSVAVCVRNDIDLGGRFQGMIVSGSNMSGKSTWLRTVGLNVVLGLAGAPVRAHRLELSPLRVGASIRIQDSLQEGSSKFYAEITRLRRILELMDGPLPVLFLLDEILHGTNSHDRRIGAEAIIRAYLERGAIGLVTTHDLALARIAEESLPQLKNVHFEDSLVDGRIVFDYRLHDGVVEHSNALALMREVGLEV